MTFQVMTNGSIKMTKRWIYSIYEKTQSNNYTKEPETHKKSPEEDDVSNLLAD